MALKAFYSFTTLSENVVPFAMVTFITYCFIAAKKVTRIARIFTEKYVPCPSVQSVSYKVP